MRFFWLYIEGKNQKFGLKTLKNVDFSLFVLGQKIFHKILKKSFVKHLKMRETLENTASCRFALIGGMVFDML